MKFQFTNHGSFYLNFNEPQAEVGERRLEIEAVSEEAALEQLIILLREIFEREIQQIEVHHIEE